MERTLDFCPGIIQTCLGGTENLEVVSRITCTRAVDTENAFGWDGKPRNSVKELLERLWLGRKAFEFYPGTNAFQWDGKPSTSIPELLKHLWVGRKTWEFCPGVT